MILTRDDMHVYQNRMVDILHDVPYAAVWAEMGLGKSSMALTAFDDLYKTLRCEKALIISTVRNVDVTWPDEIDNWEHLSHLPYTRIGGTPAQRTALLDDPQPIHAINVENLKWLVSQYKVRKNRRTGLKSCDWPYDMVVLDESGLFRNHDTTRFRALRKMRPFIDRMIQLTGSPLPKGLMNLWSQVYLLDQGERLGRTIGAYRQQWFYPNPNGFGWLPRHGAKEEIIEKLSDICFTLRSDDYLEIPEMVINPVYCTLPDAVLGKYNDFVNNQVAEFGDTVLVGVNAGVLYGKTLQLANGAYYTDDKGNWEEFHNAKLGLLEQITEETTGPLFVAYKFKFDRARIKSRFPKAVFLDEYKGSKLRDLVARWNNDEIDMLVAQPQSAGHGLNMQKGNCAGVVWFGLNPDLDLFLQFNARIRRQGQQNTTINHMLIARGTVDESVIPVLTMKEATQDAVMNAFKLYIERMRK